MSDTGLLTRSFPNEVSASSTFCSGYRVDSSGFSRTAPNRCNQTEGTDQTSTLSKASTLKKDEIHTHILSFISLLHISWQSWCCIVSFNDHLSKKKVSKPPTLGHLTSRSNHHLTFEGAGLVDIDAFFKISLLLNIRSRKLGSTVNLPTVCCRIMTHSVHLYSRNTLE